MSKSDAQKKHREIMKAIEALNARAVQLDEWRKDPDKYKPVSTGIPELDELIVGLPTAIPFYMLIVAQEKKGKSTVAQHLARAWAQGTGEKVAYYMLEELVFQYADRWIASHTSLTRNNLVKLEISDEQMQEIYEAIAEHGDDSMLLQDDVFRVDTIINECKEKGIDRVVIDNLTIADQTGVQGANSRERFENLSKLLMRARNEFGMSFIVVSQDASGEGKAFGSGQANRDADLIISVEDAYIDVDDEKVKLKDVRVLHVLESRLAPEGRAFVGFDGAKSLIYARTTVDIASQEFMTMVNQDSKNKKKKKKAAQNELPNHVELDNGAVIQFEGGEEKHVSTD